MKEKCLTKIKKFHSYAANVTEDAIKYAEINSNRVAARKYAADEKKFVNARKMQKNSQFYELEKVAIKQAARWYWRYTHEYES